MKKRGMTFAILIFTAFVISLILSGFKASRAWGENGYGILKSKTYKEVLQKGKVSVGVLNWDIPGFYEVNGDNGLEADLGRALAAAIFSDKNKVEFVKVSAAERFTALQEGLYDVLIRVSTFTMGRDTSLNINFAPIYFYDGQGIMTHEWWNLEDLDGKLIGVLEERSHQYYLDKFMTQHDLYPQIILFPNRTEMFSDYEQGQIDAVSTDKSVLNAYRAFFANPNTHVIFDEILTKEPLAPVVREGDDVWYDLVKWVIYALIQAEELGIDSNNVDSLLSSTDPDIKRFLGVEGSLGQNLHLSSDWAYQIIKQVGNYGEIYDRNLGSLTPAPLPRGQNRLHFDGGLHYSPPMM